MGVSTLSSIVLLAVIAWLGWSNWQLKSELAGYTNKRAHKQAILEALANGPLGNEELRSLLGVSARTVVSYMDELEAAGQVEQVGATGTNVTYRQKA